MSIAGRIDRVQRFGVVECAVDFEFAARNLLQIVGASFRDYDTPLRHRTAVQTKGASDGYAGIIEVIKRSFGEHAAQGTAC